MISAMAEQAPGGSKSAGKAGESPLRRPACPGCGEPWLRPTQLPGRYRCVYCLRRYELVSQCPNCGEHQTIARMSSTEDMLCQSCGDSMLKPI
jgi:ribosomal protein S27E